MESFQGNSHFKTKNIKQGKITRRLHSHDIQNPNKLINSQSFASTYENWGSLSSARHLGKESGKSDLVPIGRSKTLRSFQSESQIDPTNVYQVTKTPGPGTYDMNKHLEFGSTLPKASIRPGIGTMGSSHRDCLMKYAASHKFPERRTLSPRPGPGEYDPVRPGSASLKGMKNVTSKGEQQKLRLLQVENNIRRIKEKIKGFDRLSDDKKTTLFNDSALELKRLRSEQKALKKGLEKLGNVMLAHGHRHDVAFPYPSESIQGTVPFNSTSSDRFYHPLVNSLTSFSTPGPGEHDLHPKVSMFGQESKHKATTLGWGFRSTDPHAPEKHQLPNMRLTNSGDVYFIRPETVGPGDYIPSLLPEDV